MRIISPYKDYYDHVGHTYGANRDPHAVVYERNPTIHPICEKLSNVQRSELPFWYAYDRAICGTEQYIVVGRRMFAYVNAGDSWTLLTPELHEQLIGDTSHQPWIRRWYSDVIKSIEEHYTIATKIIRSVGLPVVHVEVTRNNSFGRPMRVLPTTPNLVKVGLAQLMTAEQCYQEIDNAVTNIIRQNPDNMPVPLITNMELIESHGFDKRVSFRHRK